MFRDMTIDLPFAWASLPEGARHALLKDPHGSLPAEYVPDVVNGGGSVYAAYWVASADGPQGFRLQPSQAAVIEGWKDKLAKWWDGLTDEVCAAVTERGGERIPGEFRNAVLSTDLVGGVVSRTVSAEEPPSDDFGLAPIAKDYVVWRSAQG